MRRTLAIVFAAALAGGAAGAAVGIAVDGGHSSAPTLHEARIVARPTSVVRTGAALSPEAISQVVAPTLFTQMVGVR
jgi:hypothetical protein